ncbi:MAG: hypothetical protein KGD74_06930 [Candidatus Lokiarchaeota archaeon]|nr:hypothetical protein [Candidatus Lokiarchaeota archaeon]
MGVVLFEVILLIVYYKLKSRKQKLLKNQGAEASEKQKLIVAQSEADAIRMWDKGRADALKLETEARIWPRRY